MRVHPRSCRSSFVPTMLFFVLLGSLVPETAYAGEPLKFVGFDKKFLSEDAQAGLVEIYSGRLFHTGMPVTAMEILARQQTEKPKLTYDPASPEGQYYSTNKIPSPPNRKAKLALGDSMFVRNKVTLVNNNCFFCHAGIVNGHVVAGLPNNREIPPNKSSDLPSPEALKKALESLTNPADKREFAEFLGSVSNRLKLPATASRGDHFGPFLVWNAGAHLEDPAKKGLHASSEKTKLVELIESVVVPNVDPMPWWLMKYKKKDYWYADGRIDDAAHFSFNFTSLPKDMNTNRNATRAAHVESTRKALAFARETYSPLFPKKLNAELVQKGADLFHGRLEPKKTAGFRACKSCHGTYTKKKSSLDLSIPGGWNVDYDGSETLKDVKTDATYNSTLQQLQPIAEHVNKLAIFYESNKSPELKPVYSVPSAPGYVAPPLVGIWASAPYFHNGSVPTIEMVLNSKSRPEIWSRNIEDPHAYNLKQVGLDYRRMSRDDFEASKTKAKRASARSKSLIDHEAIYDTKSYGHGKQGHTFGDGLTIAERAAVIEFLKSLSGPDM